MEKLVRIFLSLPADTVYEQIIDEYSGRVISTIVEADLNIGEINMGLCEFEAALRECLWGEKDWSDEDAS